jgi:diguanylate cyclase (GGDEF)-like protein
MSSGVGSSAARASPGSRGRSTMSTSTRTAAEPGAGASPSAPAPSFEDARSAGPVERLLEDSWHTRSRRIGKRELLVEGAAGALFLCAALPMALHGLAARPLDVPLAALLVVLYALASRAIEFPLGAGYAVPSYVVLVPMLLLLPPGSAPLFAAAGLVLGGLAQRLMRRAPLERVLLSLPDAWHAVGPAAVLLLAGTPRGAAATAGVYVLAFLAGCLLDLISSSIRERAVLGVDATLQLRVISFVWLIDAGFAPLGLMLAHAMRTEPAACLLVLPLGGLMAIAARDRESHIAQSQARLELLGRERARLQTAVSRLGDALAAKLDLRALSDVVLRGSIEALDGDSGQLALTGPIEPLVIDLGSSGDGAALRAAGERARLHSAPCQLVSDGIWALALPFGFLSDAGPVRGAIAVARVERPFQDDERSLMEGLVQRARQAAVDIVAHEQLRRQASTDSLTRLGNRRKLAADVEQRLSSATRSRPLTLVLFDLDGFKHYNDTFGHPAGDAALERLSRRLEAAAAPHGSAYRLGGDEFCALLAVPPGELDAGVDALAAALSEHGEGFALAASHGSVTMPEEAVTLTDAMGVADRRMYSLKRERSRRGTRT